MKIMKYFYNPEILFEFIPYFSEYEHFKLDILFYRMPCSLRDMKTIFLLLLSSEKFLLKVMFGIFLLKSKRELF